MMASHSDFKFVAQPTDEQLRLAECYFPTTDGNGDTAQSRFKRAARYNQHVWARAFEGVEQFGELNSKPNGTKLKERDALRGANFLTPDIFETAKRRVANRQKFEMLKKDRLYGDLLSSMPMAFNLFGEATRPENEVSRVALARRFKVARSGASEVVFEWSPKRHCSKYTNDGRAFDVALRIGDPDAGPVTVVGIETKYHETAAPEVIDGRGDCECHPTQQDHLAAIAEVSGVFRPGWRQVVFGSNTRLMQLMGDHLLALSLPYGNPTRWAPDSRFVLLYPSCNTSYAEAATRYREAVLKPDDLSFQAVTIETVLDDAFAHGGETREKFEQRYLSVFRDGAL